MGAGQSHLPRAGPQPCRTAVLPLLIGRNPDSVLEPVSGGSVRIALRSHPDRRAEEFGEKYCRSRIVAQQFAKLLERVDHVSYAPSNGVVELARSLPAKLSRIFVSACTFFIR